MTLAALLANDVNVAQNVGFYIIAAPMLYGAFRVVTTKNIVHAALWLVVVLAGIAAIFQLFDGLQAVASRALRGMKDTLVPMWIASIGYWLLGLLGGWLLCFPLGYGARGLWWGLALGLFVTSVALVWRLMARTRVDDQRAGGGSLCR